MTEVWDKIKKNLMESLSLAIDKTEELTSVGRIKLEILQIEHRLDEKFAELGKYIFRNFPDSKKRSIPIDEKIRSMVKELKELEAEMHKKEQQLGKIKREDGIDFDS